MTELKKELNILVSIILKPIQTINKGDITSYNEENMNKLMLILILPLAIISISLIFFSTGHPFLFAYLEPLTFAVAFALISVKLITPCIYFALFKYIGKIECTFNDVSKALFPIIIVKACLNYLISIILFINPVIKQIINLGIYIWFLIMVSVVLRYNFKITKGKIVSILSIPLIYYSFVFLKTIF